MSSVQVDISPAISIRKRDISSWVEPDITGLSARGNRRYNKRKNAVEDYFTTDLSIEELTLRHHLSSEILMRLVEQCFMQHEDGTPWGYRALVPGVMVIDHTPAPLSKKTRSHKSDRMIQPQLFLTKLLDGVPCTSDRSLLDEDDDSTRSITDEDDEDTAQRPAIKISSAEVPILLSLASVTLNGRNDHQSEIVEQRENSGSFE